jgi:hypothetical protein
MLVVLSREAKRRCAMAQRAEQFPRIQAVDSVPSLALCTGGQGFGPALLGLSLRDCGMPRRSRFNLPMEVINWYKWHES